MDYTKEEAEKRLQAALRGSRVTGHKPMSDIPKKPSAKKTTTPKTKKQNR
ncbi:hypothetical protein [Bradyrhizobium sp.]